MHYSTGQTALELGISGSKVRALCEAGLIASQITPSGHFRIEIGELERLKREGVPPVPRAEIPSANVEQQGQAERPVRTLRQVANGESVAIAETGDRAVASATDLIVMRHEVEKLALEIQLKEGQDKLAARARRQAQEKEKEERDRRTADEEAQAITKQGQWKAFWIDYAVKSVPAGAPRELLLAIAAQLETIFAASDFRQPDYSTQTLVDAAISVGLQPWRRNQEIEQIIERAVHRLPAMLRSSFGDTPVQAHAQQAARAAVHEIEQSALPEIERVAFAVVDGITAQIEHRERCQPIIDSIRRDLCFAATPDEFTAATEALRAALETSVPGLDDKELQRVKDTALLPFRATIEARRQQEANERKRAEDQEHRQTLLRYPFLTWPYDLDEEAKNSATAAAKAAMDKLPVGSGTTELTKVRDAAIAPTLKAHTALGGLSAYLKKLAGEFEIDEPLPAIERKLRPEIQADLMSKLTGTEAPEAVSKLMRRVVRERLNVSVAA